MSSMRGRRNPGSGGIDSRGDQHYPGVGLPAIGAVSNPAIQPGAATAYTYDWANTWPSGTANTPAVLLSGPFKTSKITYWLQGAAGSKIATWLVWFDIDSDPDPDLSVPLPVLLSNPDADQKVRDAIGRKARTLGAKD